MRVSVTVNRTASAALSVGSVTTAAASPRRFKLYEIICGSEATPADNAFLWQVTRRTSAGTASAVIPVALDYSDTVASTLVGGENHTVNGAAPADSILLTIPLNQRATFRWVAAPGSELVSSNAAANGYSLDTPTAGGLVAVSATMLCDEQ